MKIAHVLPALTKGGGERVAVDLANQFAADGHDVALIAASRVDPALREFALSEEVELRFVRQHLQAPGWREYGSIIPWIFAHRDWLASRDVIHCHMTFGVAFGVAVGLLRSLFEHSRPVVVETCHSVGMPIPRTNRRVQALLASRVDALALIAEDDYWCRFVTRHPGISSAVIPNGIRTEGACPTQDEIRAYRRAAGVAPDALVVGTVGRLAPARRPDVFIESFAKIAEKMEEDVQFLFVGEGSEMETTRRLAEDRGLRGRVHFPGLALRPILPLANIDLYLSLNVGPNTGIAGLEAASFGLPVIAFQMRQEYEPQPSDWIYSSNDTTKLATEAVRLLRCPVARRATAERQQAHVHDQHGVEVMAKAYTALYLAALERTHGGCRGPR